MESLDELHALLARFESHAQDFRDWARQGGPINAVWARETALLRAQLHRAQCRAAARVFAAQRHEDNPRCLGAYQVYRHQKRREADRHRHARLLRDDLPPWQRQRRQHQQRRQQQEPDGQHDQQPGHAHDRDPSTEEDDEARQRGEAATGDLLGGQEQEQEQERRGSLEELVPWCNAVGRFQRLPGTDDVAFVCDYCEGYIVWPDLQSMPSVRAPPADAAGAATMGGAGSGSSSSSSSSSSSYPHWQAQGFSAATGEEKTVVFAPLAIANHTPPGPGDWQAGLVCPFCEEATYLDQGEDNSELRYVRDENGFPDLEAFRGHLEWYHTALPVPPISSLASVLPSAVSNCAVM